MIYFVIFTGIYFICNLLKLNIISSCFFAVMVMFFYPIHKKYVKEKREKEERFYELSIYMETLLYAFLKEEKIEGAVESVALTLADGKMKHTVEEALNHMNYTFDSAEVLAEALHIITEEYDCKRVRDIHNFMLHVEFYGGDIKHTIKILLEDKRKWENRIKKTVLHRKRKVMDVILSVATSIMICGVILHLPVMNIDISKNILVQIGSLLLLMVDGWIVLKAEKYLTEDWIHMNLLNEEERSIKQLEEYRSYDEKKARKLSLVMGSIAVFLAALCFYYEKEFLVTVSLMIAAFLFTQHKLGHRLAGKQIVKELQYAFPNWLMDLVLLLQSENVQMAIDKSRGHAPGILKKELEELMNRLELEPESASPYHSFFKDFPLPELRSAMSVLYALSIGTSSRTGNQIEELIHKNLEILDLEEEERMKQRGSGIYLLFLLPVLTASFKLLIDMAIMMLHFIQLPM